MVHHTGDLRGDLSEIYPIPHSPSPATVGGGIGLLVGTYAAATLAKRKRAAAQAHAHSAKKH